MNYIVTGLICSGKSTFLNTAIEYGFDILKSDEVVAVLYNDKDVISKLSNTFKEYNFEYTPKETIKQLFYKSEPNRIKIESIFHPKVHKTIKNKLESNKNILVEVPPLKNNINIIKNNRSIFIESSLETRRKRFQSRNMKNGINYFDKLNEYQSDCLLIESYCDIIINNDSNEIHLSEYFKKEIIKS
jgi:dephospho-CoA kinase